MLVSSITWRILAPIFITVAVLGSSIILAIIYKPSLIEKTLHIKMYQMGRINSWLNPYAYSNGDGYHLTESLKAVGSGQLFGKGYNHGEVYIPENHTDFIFSVIGEEIGFIGAVILLLIFLALIFHLIRLAIKQLHHLIRYFNWLYFFTRLPYFAKYWYDNPTFTYYRYTTTVY